MQKDQEQENSPAMQKRQAQTIEGTYGCVNPCIYLCIYWRTFWLGMMCILPGMSRLARIVVVWFWIILIIIVTSMTIRFTTFGTDRIESSPGDQRIVRKMTTLMCQSVKVTNHDKATIDVYTSDGQPPLNSNKTFQLSNRTSKVYDNSYIYSVFHLISGSNVTILTTSTANVELVVLQGRNNLAIFLGKVPRRRCNNKCFLQYHTYKNGTHLAELSVSTTEDYFFLYRRSKASAQRGINFSDIKVAFFIDRATYNLSTSKQTCVLSTAGNTSSCNIDLPYMTNRQVVLTYDVKSNSETIKAMTECSPRIGSYMIFFLLVPVVTGWIISGLIMVICKENGCCGKKQPIEDLEGDYRATGMHDENAVRDDIFSSPKYNMAYNTDPKDNISKY